MHIPPERVRGSARGGISALALCRHPEVVGQLAQTASNSMVQYLRTAMSKFILPLLQLRLVLEKHGYACDDSNLDMPLVLKLGEVFDSFWRKVHK